MNDSGAVGFEQVRHVALSNALAARGGFGDYVNLHQAGLWRTHGITHERAAPGYR